MTLFQDDYKAWILSLIFIIFTLREAKHTLARVELESVEKMTGPGSSCGACKFLRRKCSSGCVFAPYFCYEQAVSNFAAVHKVFGASNVSKMLLHLPVDCRGEAAIAISYEAIARMQNPKYGCVAQILTLQQQVSVPYHDSSQKTKSVLFFFLIKFNRNIYNLATYLAGGQPQARDREF